MDDPEWSSEFFLYLRHEWWRSNLRIIFVSWNKRRELAGTESTFMGWLRMLFFSRATAWPRRSSSMPQRRRRRDRFGEIFRILWGNRFIRATKYKPVCQLQPEYTTCQMLRMQKPGMLTSAMSFALSCITTWINPALFSPIAAAKPAIPAPTMTIFMPGILACRLSCEHAVFKWNLHDNMAIGMLTADVDLAGVSWVSTAPAAAMQELQRGPRVEAIIAIC